MSEAIQHLLSLPPAMAGAFHSIFPDSSPPWFVTCDPEGHKLGSGGGVAQLLADAWGGESGEFDSWLV